MDAFIFISLRVKRWGNKQFPWLCYEHQPQVYRQAEAIRMSVRVDT